MYEKIIIIIGMEIEKIEGEITLKSNKVICGEKTNFSTTIGCDLTNIPYDVKLRVSFGSLTS